MASMQRSRLNAFQRARAAACAALLVASLPTPVRAAEPDIDLPVYDLPPPAHATARTNDTARTTTSASARSTARSAVDLSRAPASVALVELPADAAIPGSGYRRPHHALGYRWQAAESWLRDHGFDAQTCYLPMVRMHTKLAPGATSSTLWIYGRCSFR